MAERLNRTVAAVSTRRVSKGLRRVARRCEAETDLFGIAVGEHPLELVADLAWDTYCPVNRLGEFDGETVTTCGLVVELRTYHQVTGEPMKSLTLADWTGMVETELFVDTYRNYGLAPVRYPAKWKRALNRSITGTAFHCGCCAPANRGHWVSAS